MAQAPGRMRAPSSVATAELVVVATEGEAAGAGGWAEARGVRAVVTRELTPARSHDDHTAVEPVTYKG